MSLSRGAGRKEIATGCHAASPRRRVAPVFLLAGDGLVVVGSLLTWTVSGAVTRNSYATVRAARHVGLVGQPVWAAVLDIWFLVPLLAAVVAVGAVLDRRWLAPSAAIPLGLLAVIVAGLTWAAPLEHGPGPAVTAIGGTGLLIGAALWLRRRS